MDVVPITLRSKLPKVLFRGRGCPIEDSDSCRKESAVSFPRECDLGPAARVNKALPEGSSAK